MHPVTSHAPSHRHRGFTLIELLTVIAIVGILTAIVVPVVGSVRKKARAAVCMSNLRQSATALMQFGAENKDRIPMRQSQAGKWYGWDYALHQLGYLQVNLTPGSKQGERITSCPLGYDDVIIYKPDSEAYGMNITVWTAQGSMASSWKTTQTLQDSAGANYILESLWVRKIPEPSRFVMLADSFDKWKYDNLNGIQRQKSVFGEPSSRLWMRHNGGLNAAMADGHVERITPANMSRFLRADIAGGYWE